MVIMQKSRIQVGVPRCCEGWEERSPPSLRGLTFGLGMEGSVVEER